MGFLIFDLIIEKNMHVCDKICYFKVEKCMYYWTNDLTDLKNHHETTLKKSSPPSSCRDRPSGGRDTRRGENFFFKKVPELFNRLQTHIDGSARRVWSKFLDMLLELCLNQNFFVLHLVWKTKSDFTRTVWKTMFRNIDVLALDWDS